MAPKNKSEADAEAEPDPGLQLLYDHIRLQAMANAEAIFRNEKPERLVKMLQACEKLKPVTANNKELWRIVQKVRRELLPSKR